MRFGAFVPQGWRLDLVGIPLDRQWETVRAVARTIEEVGFDSVWVYDHFHTSPVPAQETTFEAWTLMGALATATSRVRLGQMCTCNSYRPPSYLAKVAATVDVLSGGRLDVGIGAGWYEHEYRGYGYEFPPGGVRIDQLAESVEILVRMWTEDEVVFAGEHYRLDGAICRPKPLQQPHIPLWVAGGGERRTLRVAARYAAYSNFGATLPEFVHKSEVLAAHCVDVGTDPSAIVRSSNFNVVCEETEAAVEDKIAWILDHYRPFVGAAGLAELEETYRATAGTPEQLVARFGEWGRAGLGYAICYFPDAAYDRAGLERFARVVVPALREAGPPDPGAFPRGRA